MAKSSSTSVGICLALASYFLFSSADTLVKGLGGSLSPFEIGLFVALFSFIPFLVTKPNSDAWRDTFKYNRPWLVHLVALMRATCAMSMTYAFVTIPLAEAYAIAFLIPLFTTMMSVAVLKEKVPLERWVLVILGFIGILIVVRPGFRELELGHFTSLLCAVCASIQITTMRIIAGNERRTSISVLQATYTVAANFAVLAVVGLSFPSWELLLGLMVCGIMGGVAYIAQIGSLERAPASLIAPTQYSQFIWGLLFGAVFFSELPDFVGFIGLAIVLASGVGSVFVDGIRAKINQASGPLTKVGGNA